VWRESKELFPRVQAVECKLDHLLGCFPLSDFFSYNLKQQNSDSGS
jgi:hypothetical protein